MVADTAIKEIKSLKVKCCICNRAYANSFFKTKPFCSKCWNRRKEKCGKK